jgi:hypothetical protein
VAGEDAGPGQCSRSQHRVACVAGGIEAPCREAQQLGENGVGIAQGLAADGQLAGDRDVPLVYSLLLLVYGLLALDEG